MRLKIGILLVLFLQGHAVYSEVDIFEICKNERPLMPCLALAKQGHMQAQWLLCLKYSTIDSKYRHPEIKNPDYKKALYWCKKQYDQSLSSATAEEIGGIYSSGGFGVKQDKNEAMLWYEKSDNQTCAIKLGLFLKNYTKVRELCETAIEKRSYRHKAYYFLGQVYEKGLGVEKDYKKAVAYYNKSAEFGSDFPTAYKLIAEANKITKMPAPLGFELGKATKQEILTLFKKLEKKVKAPSIMHCIEKESEPNGFYIVRIDNILLPMDDFKNVKFSFDKKNILHMVAFTLKDYGQQDAITKIAAGLSCPSGGHVWLKA